MALQANFKKFSVQVMSVYVTLFMMVGLIVSIVLQALSANMLGLTTNNVPTVVIDKANFIEPNQYVDLHAYVHDKDGVIVNYDWRIESPIPVFDLQSFESKLSFLTPNLPVGEHVTVSLTVTDNSGASTTDNLKISVCSKADSVERMPII